MASGIRLSRMPERMGPAVSRFGASVKPVDPFYTSPEWRGFAARVKAARGFRCEACGADCSGAKHRLRADHIAARKDGGADFDPRNIAVLCVGCDNRKRGGEHRARGMGSTRG